METSSSSSSSPSSSSSSWLPEKMISQHGKEVLIVGGYKMRFHKLLKRKTVKRWCCAKKTCKSYLKTDLDERIIESHLHHNHAVEGNMLRQVVRNSVKGTAREKLCERPKKLIQAELRDKNITTGLLTAKDMDCIRKGIYEARRSAKPKTPADIRHVHDVLDALVAKTFGDEQRAVLANDRRDNVVMLTFEKNLITLCNVRTVYVDGTTEHCMPFFSQLLVVCGLYNGHDMPLVFFLTNGGGGGGGRRPETYASCFARLRREFAVLNLRFDPDAVYLDFDKSLHAGARAVWPNLRIKGCRFHLNRAWWRKIHSLGLSAQCREQTEIGLLLRNVFGLPLLDEHDAVECFVDDFMSIKPDDEAVGRFMDYLTENFVDSQSDYPPHVWTDASSDGETVSSACENFRATLGKRFRSTSPTVFSYLKTLKKIQIDTKLAINTSIDTPRKLKTNERKKIAFIEDNILKYRHGLITRLNFVKLMAMKNQPEKSKRSPL